MRVLLASSHCDGHLLGFHMQKGKKESNDPDNGTESLSKLLILLLTYLKFISTIILQAPDMFGSTNGHEVPPP